MAYLLIDGNNLAARCFFAQRELRTTDGRCSGGVHGFLKAFSSARSKLGIPLQNTCVFWDAGRAKRRIEIYPEYKQGRKLSAPQTPQEEETTREFKNNLNGIRSVLATRPIRQVLVPGTEADDLIAVLACTLNAPCVVFSGDRDIHQLASGTVNIYDPKRGLIGLHEIADYWGLPVFDADQIVLLKAVMGDPTDNIKGVPTIGEVRAAKALPYLKLEGKQLQLREAPADPKVTKIVDKIFEHKDLVDRNIRLMQLPTTWQEALYDEAQMEAALIQFLKIPESNYSNFMGLLSEWELDSISEQLERW